MTCYFTPFSTVFQLYQGNYERQCAMEPCLGLERFPPDELEHQGPVVQSIISLTSSLTAQLNLLSVI